MGSEIWICLGVPVLIIIVVVLWSALSLGGSLSEDERRHEDERE
jgi:hypothetical protein